jgi:hypothetical protein
MSRCSNCGEEIYPTYDKCQKCNTAVDSKDAGSGCGIIMLCMLLGGAILFFIFLVNLPGSGLMAASVFFVLAVIFILAKLGD